MLPNDDTTPDLPESWFNANIQRFDLVEIIALATVIPAVLFWFAWFTNTQATHWLLPLLLLIPLLLGLRYGFFGGVIAALLVASVLLAVSYTKPEVLVEFPKIQVVIFLVCGGIAGQFRDFWASHLRRIHALSVYHQTRLAQFSSAFHLLQLSHSQLERQLAGTAVSLRTSLQQLKKKLQTMEVDANLPLGGIGPLLLDFLADAGDLHIASIYAINERGELSAAPVSMVGNAPALSPSHPLLLQALRTGSVTSVHANDTGTGEVIAIVPLADSRRHIHGVVCINAMPFSSIHHRTFDLLNIIARQTGDVLALRSQGERRASINLTLRTSLISALLKARHEGLPIVIIAYKILEQAQSESVIKLCLQVNRGVDQSWKWHDRDGLPVIVNFLIMTDEAAAQRQVHRLRQLIAEQHGSVIATKGLQSHVWEIRADDDANEVWDRVCLACDIVEHECDLDFPGSTVLAS